MVAPGSFCGSQELGLFKMMLTFSALLHAKQPGVAFGVSATQDEIGCQPLLKAKLSL